MSGRSLGLRQVVVALDWTPNTNHVGIFAAASKGLYARAGLAVEVVSADDARYSGSYVGGDGAPEAGGEYTTPCKLCAGGGAHFAMNSPEGVVNWNLRGDAPGSRLVAVAALCSRNTSAIAARKGVVSRPRDLDGRRYASYAARFEGRIVQRLIQADGGKGEYEEVVSPMLGLWNTVLADRDELAPGEQTDATWVFTCWEGVDAEMRGDAGKLNYFRLEDFGIPYGYAPCLVATPETLAADPALVRDFLRATAEGYEWAAANPQAAAKVLVSQAKELCGFGGLQEPMCALSMERLAPALLDEDGCWGRMHAERWEAYLDWLHDEKLLTRLTNSRAPVAGQSASLDDLRAGGGREGDVVGRDEIPASRVYTNAYF